MTDNLFGEPTEAKQREPDLAYEALAEATDAHPVANRGELNIALKTIRVQTTLRGGELADEIRDHAEKYRRAWPELTLSPNALAQNWVRVQAEVTRPPRATNQAATSHDECQTCGGDRFVIVGTRPAKATRWMQERGIEVVGDAAHDEYAPCPDCNAMQVTMRRYDGTLVETPDAARTRERLQR